MRILLYILLILLFLGCKKTETDNQKPFISITKPANHVNVILGHNLLYEIEFKDDFELKEFRIKIQSATIPIIKHIETNFWDTSFVGSISGIEAFTKDKLLIPLNIDTGRYLFMIYCKDKTGNEEFTARDFNVTSSK